MFFNKPVDSLNLAQIALLAGLPQAPTTYNPFVNQSGLRCGAAERGAPGDGQVRLHQPGDSERDAGRAAAGHAERLLPDGPPAIRGRLRRAAAGEGRGPAQRRPRWPQDLHDDQSGGPEAGCRGDRSERGAIPATPAASLVSIDPSTGHIVALQNSTTYGTGKGETTFDYATQAARQTGSSFKPFVLMTAGSP